MKLKTVLVAVGVAGVGLVGYHLATTPNAFAMVTAGGSGSKSVAFIPGVQYVAARQTSGGTVYDVVINKVLVGSYADQDIAEQTYNRLIGGI